MRLGWTWRGFYQWLVPGTSPARAQRLRAVLEWAVAIRRFPSDPPGRPQYHVDRLSSACTDEQKDAVACEPGFGPLETIKRVDHNDTLTITLPVGLDELASTTHQTR